MDSEFDFQQPHRPTIINSKVEPKTGDGTSIIMNSIMTSEQNIENDQFDFSN